MVNVRDGYSNTIKLQTNVSLMLMKTSGPLTFHILILLMINNKNTSPSQ